MAGYIAFLHSDHAGPHYERLRQAVGAETIAAMPEAAHGWFRMMDQKHRQQRTPGEQDIIVDLADMPTPEEIRAQVAAEMAAEGQEGQTPTIRDTVQPLSNPVIEALKADEGIMRLFTALCMDNTPETALRGRLQAFHGAASPIPTDVLQAVKCVMILDIAAQPEKRALFSGFKLNAAVVGFTPRDGEIATALGYDVTTAQGLVDSARQALDKPSVRGAIAALQPSTP